MHRRVIAYHVVLTCYGFWLPNDPRGSWSDFVRAIELYRVGGPATKVETTRSVAGESHDRQKRLAAKAALSYPPVVWNGAQGREVARGLGDYAGRGSRAMYAAAVMPDHVHLVVGRTEQRVEVAAERFKAAATTRLNAAGLHPFADRVDHRGRIPTPWARHEWSVFLDDETSVQRAIRYVQDNPVKAGYKRQEYPWVKEWDGR